MEINNTFYRLPEPDIFDRWREQARPGFVYAVKANQFLTHRKRLKDAQGTAKNVIGRRLKQIGARWRVRRVNRMATLCCAVYSDHWNSYRDGICK